MHFFMYVTVVIAVLTGCSRGNISAAVVCFDAPV